MRHRAQRDEPLARPLGDGLRKPVNAAQAGALLAVGAAAVSLVAGIGTYLYIRFTQQRKRPPEDPPR